MNADIPAIEGGAPVRPRERALIFGSPAIGPEEIAGVVDSLTTRWIGTGPKVRRLEERFAAYKNAPHAVAVGSDTAALELALRAMGIGPGDEVITTPMTFCATVNAIIHTGAAPVLADCDPRTFNILPREIERRLSERTRAIIVVHMCGRCCEMDAVMGIARAGRLRVIEDCAHAIESTWRGAPAGTMGDAGCFSFYVTKNLTTAEGGMVVTPDAAIASMVKTLALHGLSADAWMRHADSGYRHYAVVEAGFKYNLTDVNAAIGLAQFDKLDRHSERRSEIWRTYLERFSDLPCLLPPPAEHGSRHALHLFTPLLELDRLRVSRDHVLAALGAENIGVGVHYLPVHLQPYYRRTRGWKEGDFPNAEIIGERTLSLPLAGDLDDRAVDDVCEAFRRILRYYRR